MVSTANVLSRRAGVVLKMPEFALLVTLKDEARAEMAAAFGDVSGKRINAASLPGFGRHGVIRAVNGSDTNPLYRIAGLLVLMKRLGMDRATALRWLEWLRQIVNRIWPDEGTDELRAVLDRDAALDGMDELPRQRAYAGDEAAARELLAIKTRQIAMSQEVAEVLRQRLAEQG